MCGIFGYSSQGEVDKARLSTLMGTLAVLNTSRGKDSWGVFFHKPDGTLWTQRGLGLIVKAPMVELCENPTLACHTRWKTVGAATLENAHPFQVGEVVGSHNGCIYSHEKLNTTYSRKYQVDSKHIFAHLANNLPKEELEGYGAIEFAKLSKPFAMHLATWQTNELSVYRVKFNNPKGRLVVWSSDGDHLVVALQVVGWYDAATEIDIPTQRVVEIRDGAFYHREKFLVSEGRSYLASSGVDVVDDDSFYGGQYGWYNGGKAKGREYSYQGGGTGKFDEPVPSGTTMPPKAEIEIISLPDETNAAPFEDYCSKTREELDEAMASSLGLKYVSMDEETVGVVGEQSAEEVPADHLAGWSEVGH